MSKRMPLLALVASFVVCTYAVPAYAVVTAYTDRTTFENAIAIEGFFDFEDLPGGSANPLGNAVPFGDATVISTDNSGIYSTTSFGAPTVQVGSQNGGGVRIELLPGHRALGMDIGELFGPATFDYTLTLSAGAPIVGTINVAENDDLGTINTTFFGYVSDDADILSYQINSQGSGV